MKQVKITALFLSLLCTSSHFLFAQSEISSPRLWLRSDEAGNQPLQWQDVSSNGNHALATEGKLPADTAWINFNPAHYFDGADDYLSIPLVPDSLNALSFMAVFQSVDTTERGIWGSELSLQRAAFLSTRKGLGPDSMIDNYGKREMLPTLTSAVQIWENTPLVNPISFFSLGSGGQQRSSLPIFKGKLAEVLLFDKSLSFLERTQYETYLAIKYGLTKTEGNYVDSRGRLLWSLSELGGHTHRMLALGRDDFFGLYQKQGMSADDTTQFLVLSAGPLATTNEANAFSMAQGSFIIMGDNNQSLEDKRGEGIDSLLSVTQRNWHVNVAGEASAIGTHLYVDFSQLSPDSLGYWLIIDRSGNGNFSADEVEYLTPASVSSQGIAHFENIYWDTDGNGRDAFAFAREKYLFASVRTLQNPYCDSPEGGIVRIDLLGGRPNFEIEVTGENSFQSAWKGESGDELNTLAAGTYSLTVTDADGYKISRPFLLSMPDAIAINIGEDRKLGRGETLSLDASANLPDTGGLRYEWSSNYGFYADTPQVTISENGIYTVTVINGKGCRFSDELIVAGDTKRFSVLPTISSDGRYSADISLNEAADVTLRVFDNSGSMQAMQEGKGVSEYHFEGTLQGKGIFFLVLQSPEGIQTRKVVVY